MKAATDAWKVMEFPGIATANKGVCTMICNALTSAHKNVSEPETVRFTIADIMARV